MARPYPASGVSIAQGAGDPATSLCAAQRSCIEGREKGRGGEAGPGGPLPRIRISESFWRAEQCSNLRDGWLWGLDVVAPDPKRIRNAPFDGLGSVPLAGCVTDLFADEVQNVLAGEANAL